MKRSIYTEEHEAFRSTVRSFVETNVVPHYEAWEKQDFAPNSLLKELAALDITGFDIPEEYGGVGEVDYRYHAIISEETARFGMMMGNHNLSSGVVLPYLLSLGTPEQKRRWLPGIAAGETLLAIGMSEPGTGSDLAGIRTSAVRDGDHYILNGAKTFISGGSQADLIVVVARTSPPSPTERRTGLSLLVLDTSSKGFSIGKRLHKVGRHISDSCELSFADIRVPAENLLGEEGQAFSYLGRNLPRERLSIAVTAAASAASAIEITKKYVAEREAFGQPISSFQNTKFVLAAARTQVTAAWALCDQAMRQEAAGSLTPADAAQVKLFCSEVAGRVMDDCLQLHGGYGYILEYPIARMYADARLSRIVGGTTEIMKSIIAKDMGL